MGKSIHGLIAAAMTPMQADEHVDLDRIPTLVEHAIRDRLAGLYVCGSTGEGVSLTTEERKSVAARYVTEVAGRIPVIIQVGHTSLRDARDLARHAQSVGADAISAMSPFYFRPQRTDDLIDCMARIADAAADLPFYYYHIPALTGVQVNALDFLEGSSSRLPTLRGMKYTSPDPAEFAECNKVALDRDLQMMWGCDEMLVDGILAGARAAVGSTYNFAAPLYHRIITALEHGDEAAARREQERSKAMVTAIMQNAGQAGLKATMKLIGIDCGPTRLPLVTPDQDTLQSMHDALEDIGFFGWARNESEESAS